MKTSLGHVFHILDYAAVDDMLRSLSTTTLLLTINQTENQHKLKYKLKNTS